MIIKDVGLREETPWCDRIGAVDPASTLAFQAQRFRRVSMPRVVARSYSSCRRVALL